MNQPIREALPTPTGWLVAPTRDFCLFFIRDPKSVMVAPTVFTQLWYCTEEGIPTKLKNTRRFDYESAHETWNELLSNDWTLVQHHINSYNDFFDSAIKTIFKEKNPIRIMKKHYLCLVTKGKYLNMVPSKKTSIPLPYQ